VLAALSLALLCAGASACGSDDTQVTQRPISSPTDMVDPSLCPKAAAPSGNPWSYDGPEGQANWGTTDGYANCGTGKDQSPIDIENPVTSGNSPGMSHAYTDGPGLFYNNGHTFIFQFPDKASPGTLELDGVTYTLKQFHFHSPSEHRINGKAYPMEAHFVHTAPPLKDGDPPRRAVVAVMLDIGGENTVLAPLWQHLTTTEGAGTCLESNGIGDMLFKDGDGFYRYDGSLTTPDCSEGVQWVVMQTPQHISAEQFGQFAAIYPDNARYVQPLDGRTITLYPGHTAPH
jgi:carbonic anhydrase